MPVIFNIFNAVNLKNLFFFKALSAVFLSLSVQGPEEEGIQQHWPAWS